MVRLDLLHSDVSEMKDAIRHLTSTVAKLAILEERLSNITNAMERAFVTINQIEARLKVLEQLTPLTSQTNRWVEKVMFAMIGAVMIAAAHKLGIA